MAKLFAGKHTSEENCIMNDHKENDDIESTKLVVKFDCLNNGQIEIGNLRKIGDEGIIQASYFANENGNINYGLSLNECDCCSATIATPNDSDKCKAMTMGLPPAIEEWIVKTKNRIAEIDKLYSVNSDAMISAENNVDKSRQEINADMDFEASWMEDFELKFDSTDESQDELENKENHDPNIDDRLDNFMKTGANQIQMTVGDTCKVDKKIENICELTPKMSNEKRQNEKKHQHLKNCLNYLTSPDCSKRLLVEPRKPLQMKTNKETGIVKLSHEMFKLFNAKVVLERLPLSPLPSNQITPKLASPISEVKFKSDPSSKYTRYCPKCKLNYASLNHKDMKCLKCSTILSFKCLNCDNEFKSYNILLYHPKCCISDYSATVGESRLRSHVKTHSKSLDLKCSNCQKKFTLEKNLKKHLIDCKGSKKDKIGAGNKKVVSGRRIETDSNSIKRRCPNCRKNIKGVLSKSCPRCRNPLEFSCLKCEDTFCDYSCIIYHLENKECDELSGKQFHCPNCIRLPRDSKKCLFCSYQANSIFILIEHFKLFHIIKSSNVSSSETDLQLYDTHKSNNVPSFVDNLLISCATNPHQLYDTVKSNNVSSFIKNLWTSSVADPQLHDTLKTNNVSSSVNNNLQLTSSNNVTDTGKSNNVSSSVDNKKRKRNEEYVCSTCGTEFAHKWSLKGHERLVCAASVTTWKCKLCDFESRFAYNFRRHRTTVHQEF